jgi:hypothetical protein
MSTPLKNPPSPYYNFTTCSLYFALLSRPRLLNVPLISPGRTPFLDWYLLFDKNRSSSCWLANATALF